jgi:hypothetical protein
MQKPKYTPDELEKIEAAERSDQGHCFLNFGPAVVRCRVFSGETKEAARSRWFRERQLEEDWEREARRDHTGRVLPVGMDDE